MIDSDKTHTQKMVGIWLMLISVDGSNWKKKTALHEVVQSWAQPNPVIRWIGMMRIAGELPYESLRVGLLQL